MDEQNTNERVTPFAVTNYRDRRQAFGIKQKDRGGHMYLVGKTGTGKSTLLENLIYSDIKAGNGLALIDPHGDLAENVLRLVPKERMHDVIYFNPADIEYPIAFNPLEQCHPDHHHLIASGLISVFKKLWSEFWGPRLEHILRNSIMALLEFPGSTLVDVSRLLTDDVFRKEVVQAVTNQQVKDFWLQEFDNYSKWYKADASSPILNKIGQFLTTLPIRNIVAQKRSSFDLREVMDQKKILVINLSKGKIGEDSTALLGAMLVTKLQLAALSRADMPEEQRIPFYLYVDEVHNFLTESFADILSEARKYGLRLILAHQYIRQLDEKIRDAVLGNVGTLISFRVGIKDAEYLSKEFGPVFAQSDFVNLPNYHIYLKLMIDGKTSKGFSAMTFAAPWVPNYRKAIIELSRKRYGGNASGLSSTLPTEIM